MAPQFFNNLFTAINTFLGANMGFFDASGTSIFAMLATIMLAWFGIEWATSGWDLSIGMGKFVNLMVLIGIGYAMMYFYDSPLPWWGGSGFHQLITGEAEYLAHQITAAQSEAIITRLAALQAAIQTPWLTDVVGMLAYVGVTVAIWLLEALSFVIIGFGLIAEAVFVLMGPIFIPFFLVPKLDWLFWGWLRGFIQYAFYQVVGAGVIFVCGNMIIPGLNTIQTGPLSVVELIGAVPVIMIMLISGIYAISKVPMITNHMFSGSSGGSLGPLVAGVIARVIA